MAKDATNESYRGIEVHITWHLGDFAYSYKDPDYDGYATEGGFKSVQAAFKEAKKRIDRRLEKTKMKTAAKSSHYFHGKAADADFNLKELKEDIKELEKDLAVGERDLEENKEDIAKLERELKEDETSMGRQAIRYEIGKAKAERKILTKRVEGDWKELARLKGLLKKTKSKDSKALDSLTTADVRVIRAAFDSVAEDSDPNYPQQMRCVCGHSNGAHSKEAGKPSYRCALCDCKSFRPAKPSQSGDSVAKDHWIKNKNQGKIILYEGDGTNRGDWAVYSENPHSFRSFYGKRAREEAERLYEVLVEENS